MARDFAIVFHQARLEAQRAGEAWLAAHTRPQYVVTEGNTNRIVGSMLDVCGRWYVQTKLNTAFGRWWKGQCHGGVPKWLHFDIPLEGRQEMGLHEAMAKAAKASLEADGIEGLSLYSWID